MIKHRNYSKEFVWINNFIKTHYDDSDAPMIKCMAIIRNNMAMIKNLEAKVKELEEKIQEMEK